MKKSHEYTTDKKYAERVHAKKRLAERYGIIVNREEYNLMTQLIGTHRAFLMLKQSERVFVYGLRYAGRILWACWDRIRKEFITFLPADAFALPRTSPKEA